jgi:hypothetical protein
MVILCSLKIREQAFITPARIVDQISPIVVVVFVASYPANYSFLIQHLSLTLPKKKPRENNTNSQ